MTGPKGGPIKRIRQLTGVRTVGDVAVPVYGYLAAPSGIPVEGGPATPVVLIEDSDLIQNGGKYSVSGDPHPLPVIDAIDGAIVEGGPALPVYLAGGALLGGGGGTPYLLLDEFTTALTAGNVNGTAAEPGAGARSVADTGSDLSLASGRLVVVDGAESWNDPKIWYGPWARALVGGVTARVRLRGTTSIGPGLFVAGSNAPADPTTGAYGLYPSSTINLRAAQAGSGNLQSVGTRLRSIDYQLTVIPRPGGGAWAVISGGIYGDFPNGTLIWVADTDSITDLYAGLSNNVGGWFADDFRVENAAGFASLWGSRNSQALLADSFTGANGTIEGRNAEVGSGSWHITSSTAAISSNKLAYGTGTVGLAIANAGSVSRIIRTKVTTPASGIIQVGIAFRSASDGSTYVRFVTTAADACAIAFGGSTLYSGAITTLEASTTYILTVVDWGTHVTAYIDGTNVTGIIATTDNNDQTYAGPRTGGSDNGSLFDDFECWPSSVTLPSAIADFPAPPAGSGAALASDAFTDDDSTPLSTHDADWVTSGGDWEINSNKARISAADTAGLAVQDVGTDDHQSEVVITLPAAPVADDWFCGPVARYTDANNYLMARYIYQSNSPEVEIIQLVGGSASVIAFVNLGAGKLAGSSTHTLALAVKGDEAAAYHDGELVCQVKLGALLTGNKCGVGIQAPAEGQPTFDDWEATAT